MLNPLTDHISHQFHIIFDDNFETIKATTSAKNELTWLELHKSSTKESDTISFEPAKFDTSSPNTNNHTSDKEQAPRKAAQNSQSTLPSRGPTKGRRRQTGPSLMMENQTDSSSDITHSQTKDKITTHKGEEEDTMSDKSSDSEMINDIFYIASNMQHCIRTVKETWSLCPRS